MSDSPLSPHQPRSAHAAYAELGPEYNDAVVASFLVRVGQTMAARADARLAGMGQSESPTGLTGRHRGGRASLRTGPRAGPE
jgi:broad specificity phosphatase PhoE